MPRIRRTLFRRWTGALAGALAFAGSLTSAGHELAEGSERHRYRVDDGVLIARGDDGRARSGPALRGARLRVHDERGREALVRIDEVLRDPLVPGSALQLFALSRYEPSSQRWRPFCTPGPSGRPLALAVRRGDEVAFSCTSGATGKCIRIGYYPWAVGPDGASLRPFHEACVKMMRADYCGDGTPYTRAGTPVAWIDRAGMIPAWEPRARASLRVEAVWGPEGAICLRRVRHPDLITLERLSSRCPRLATRARPCDERLLEARADALLVSRS